MLEITSAIRLEGEDVGIELANKYLDEIAKTGSITIGDETYTNPIVVGDIQKEIRAATFNPQVFVKLADDRLMDASSKGINDYLNGKNGILNEKQIKGLIEETVELSNVDVSTFYLEGTNDFNETITIGISTDLSDIIADVKTHSNELIQEIIDTIPADITQPNDKAQYIQDQIEEKGLREQLKQKLIDSIKSYAPEKTNEVDIKTLEKDLIKLDVSKETINTIKNSPNAEAELEDLKRTREAGESNYSLQNGKVQTSGFFYHSRLESFKQANENDAWIDSDNKLDNHAILVRKGGRNEANRISNDILKAQGDLSDKIEAYSSIYNNHLSILGVDTNALTNGYTYIIPIAGETAVSPYPESLTPQKVTIDNVMKSVGIGFSDFGIRLGTKKASFRNTIKAIEAYEADLTVDPTMQSIADKYDMDVSTLYALQREYFEQNGYLK
jgi:hypothetical protein